MSGVAEITEFHAHVYFDTATREKAERLRERLAARFALQAGRLHEEPIGPHPSGMYEVKFGPDHFGPSSPG